MIGSSRLPIAECRFLLNCRIGHEAEGLKIGNRQSAIGNRQSAIGNALGHTGDVNADR
jgi:hypothetical protein